MSRRTNYIHELLAILTESELADIRTLDLKGKERAVLDHYIQHIGSEPPTKEAIGSVLSMSGTHIDKTNSIVLKRCYEALVGADSRALWLFLRQKHLPRHIYHELLLEERELTKRSDDDRLASFYYDAFELL